MSFRSLLIFLTVLTIISRTAAGLIIIFVNSDLPSVIQLFSGGLVIYGIWILIYYRFISKSCFPFIVLFSSEVLILIINLSIINYQYTDKWYKINLPMIEQAITGNLFTVIVNLLLISYYFIIFNKKVIKK